MSINFTIRNRMLPTQQIFDAYSTRIKEIISGDIKLYSIDSKINDTNISDDGMHCYQCWNSVIHCALKEHSILLYLHGSHLHWHLAEMPLLTRGLLQQPTKELLRHSDTVSKQKRLGHIMKSCSTRSSLMTRIRICSSKFQF
jgi:hypothetical protein